MNGQTTSVQNASLNLLPEDILVKRNQSSKFTLVYRLNIIALVVLIVITSLVLFLRIIQESALKEVKEEFNSNENRLKLLTSKEKDMLLLKQRLAQIQSLRGEDTKKKAVFNLMVQVMPADVEISDIQVDKKGKVITALGSESLSSIETLLSKLSSKDSNGDLISKVDLESLSLGRTGIYRFSLVMLPK